MKLFVQIVVSLALLAVGFFVPLTIDWSKQPELAAAATGWVGIVVGYWLK